MSASPKWVFVAAILAVGAPAAAQQQAYANDPLAVSNGGMFEAGFRFTVNSPIALVELGAYDDGGNGLRSAHTVSLWRYNSNDSGTLLTAVNFNPGTSGALVGNYRYIPVTPQLLTVGQSYVVAASNYGNNEALGNFIPNTAPVITFNDGRASDQSGSAYPMGAASTQIAYGGANFRFNSVAPEPATWTLMIVGFGIIGGTLRRNNRRVASGSRATAG